MHPLCTLISVGILLFCKGVGATGHDYASDKELATELMQRKEDIERTAARLAELTRQEENARRLLQRAIEDDKRTQAAAMERARMYYLISKNGGALEFILNADSVVDMLKRHALLKQILIRGLEARRESGLRVASTEQQLSIIKKEKAAALNMHAMLSQTLSELTAKIEQRDLLLPTENR